MMYIAYGSNMNLSQMAYRCPNSKVVGKGILRGWKLVFNIHADIIPTGNREDTVPVVVWDIAKQDWKRLDMYEGYPRYYVKEEILTDIEDAGACKCIAYVMAPDRKGYEPPYQNYFDVIKTGCEENGIDVQYLYDAVNEAYDKSEKMNGIMDYDLGYDD